MTFLKLEQAAAKVERLTSQPEFDVDNLRLELARGILHTCFWHDGWLGVFDAKPGALARPSNEISVPLNKRTASRVYMFSGHLCSLTPPTERGLHLWHLASKLSEAIFIDPDIEPLGVDEYLAPIHSDMAKLHSQDFSEIPDELWRIESTALDAYIQSVTPPPQPQKSAVASFDNTSAPAQPAPADGQVHVTQVTPDVAVVLTGGSGQAEAEKGKVEKPWLVADPMDPSPEYDWYIPARYYAREAINEKPTLIANKSVLADDVSRLMLAAGIRNRGKLKKYDSGTVKKALVKVRLT